MAYIVNSRIIRAECTLKTQPKKLRIVFEGSFGSYFITPGLSFDMENQSDMQELDLLMQITDVMGQGWQSQLVNKEVRLMIDFEEPERGSCTIAIKAIGHRKYQKFEDGDDDLWIVLNSGRQLLYEEQAQRTIQLMEEQKAKKANK